jgi:hypothetical protein
MRYLITGKLARAHDVLTMSHEDLVQFVRSRVAPSLRILVDQIPHGRVLAGGLPAGGRDMVMIADLRGEDSHRVVRQFLVSLPVYDYYEWQVTPLETFEELVKFYDV